MGLRRTTEGGVFRWGLRQTDARYTADSSIDHSAQLSLTYTVLVSDRIFDSFNKPNQAIYDIRGSFRRRRRGMLMDALDVK